jgi:immune inhibitor A
MLSLTFPDRIELGDVKDSHKVLKLWTGGQPQAEYFLVENRQKKGRDADLPFGKTVRGGLFLWHIDESKADNHDETTHYKVALVQSDNKKDLEKKSHGDGGDPFPGEKNVRHVHSTTEPSTKAYDGTLSRVGLKNISDPDHNGVMTFEVIVKGKTDH